MGLNPRFNISIQIEEGQEKWVEIMKEKLKERLITTNHDYFAIIEEEKENLIISFIPSRYTSQEEFVENFIKNVLEPAKRRASELEK